MHVYLTFSLRVLPILWHMGMTLKWRQQAGWTGESKVRVWGLQSL